MHKKRWNHQKFWKDLSHNSAMRLEIKSHIYPWYKQFLKGQKAVENSYRCRYKTSVTHENNWSGLLSAISDFKGIILVTFQHEHRTGNVEYNGQLLKETKTADRWKRGSSLIRNVILFQGCTWLHTIVLTWQTPEEMS